MKKRIMSVILVILLVLSMALSLAACGQTTAEQAIRMGDWLVLVADYFGMQGYQQAEPYFTRVQPESSYYDAFQLAAEWDIVAPSSQIDAETPLTWNDVLVSLVNAGAFLPLEAEDSEKVDYAIRHFDSNIRDYWAKRYIRADEAIPLLITAQGQWAAKSFEEKIETWSMGDQVKDLAAVQELSYSKDDGVVRMDASQAQGLKPGDLYTLPGIPGQTEASINRVESIAYEGGEAVIVNDPTLTQQEALDAIEEIHVQETAPLDFNDISAIYDAEGNQVYAAPAASSLRSREQDFYPSALAARVGGEDRAQPGELGFFDNSKGELSFNTPIGKFSGKLTPDSITIGYKKKLGSKDSNYRDSKSEVSVEVSFNHMKLTKEIDFSWGKLHSATAKLDFGNKIAGKVSFEQNNMVGEDFAVTGQGAASLNKIISGYASGLGNLKTKVYNTKYTDKSVYICRITVCSGGIGSIDFIVKGKVSWSGELKLEISYSGTKGIEYKKGNIRSIDTTTKSVNFAAEGKVEATICPGFQIYAFGLTIAEVTIDLGAGAKVSAVAHLVDDEFHEIYTGTTSLGIDDAMAIEAMEPEKTNAKDILALAEANGLTWNNYDKRQGETVKITRLICFELTIYPIVRLSAAVLPGTWFEAKFSKDFLGDKNPLLSVHIDKPIDFKNLLEVGGDIKLLGKAECGYQFTPWDELEEKAEEQETEAGVDFENDDNDPILTTSNVVLSSSAVFPKTGGSVQLAVTGLPQGYGFDDLEAMSSNEKIATYDVSRGLVVGVSEGIATITVRTKDGKYSGFCSVTVSGDSQISFNGLP